MNKLLPYIRVLLIINLLAASGLTTLVALDYFIYAIEDVLLTLVNVLKSSHCVSEWAALQFSGVTQLVVYIVMSFITAFGFLIMEDRIENTECRK